MLTESWQHSYGLYESLVLSVSSLRDPVYFREWKKAQEVLLGLIEFEGGRLYAIARGHLSQFALKTMARPELASAELVR